MSTTAPSAAAAQDQTYEGYLFAYFTGEGSPDGEQIHLAASNGNDPLHWTALNGGAPVLRSTLGDQGVRDPFLLRSPTGDRFYLLATDLRMHGDGDWDNAQRHGSRSIMIWESTDLVHWSPQRAAQVAPETAGDAWAPEARWDPETQQYVVFWASTLYSPDDPEHTGQSHHRMMYATTKDFITFSPAQVWHDPGHSVIDSTVIDQAGTHYRFTKDERAQDAANPCGKFITQEKSTALLNPAWEFVADCIGKGDETGEGIAYGEGPTAFRSNTEHKWYLFIDEYGGRGYVPFETDDLGSGRWRESPDYALPANPRHGTVLPLTKSEHERVRNAYPAAR
ncbi:glycoside hydrolase family 43 protein [Saccharopolyspora mangrovi]|uniref:Glycoside hydrolase family 43 protein n=1 Tax=Saccharopolyspora mangrovi TaxID=3082379 RepID=A0ABU6ABK3_9PSEU|nr:glycoside hydrolase family 43 protein [Saccharopolyspora sp. S2-29]MEB3368919.1 glycoside hydrolase family 43 protein [Saccharopolyspora sp. S2-29]